MKDNNQFETFLRDKLSEKSFPYDEAYWEQAQQQFAEWDQKKKRRRGLLWIFAGLLLFSIGGWTLGQFLEPTPFEEEFSMMNSGLNVDSASENLSICVDIPFHPVELPDHSDDLSNDVSTIGSVETSSSVATQTYLPIDLHDSIFENNIASVSPVELQVNTQVEPKLDIQTESQRPIQIESKVESQAATTQSELGVSDFFIDTISNSIDALVKEDFKKQTENLQGLQGIKDPKIRLLSVNDRIPPPIELLEKKPPNMRIYLQVGTSAEMFLSRWVDSTSQWADSTHNILYMNPAIETGITFPTRAGINVNVGLSYFSTQLLNTSMTLDYITYDFVGRFERKIWTPEELHFAGLHLGASTRILFRHELGLDARVNYLLTTKGKLGEIRRNTLETFTYELADVWHYRNGLPSWDLQTGLSYQFHVTQKLGIKTEAYYGFRSLTQDERFFPARRHRNSRLFLSFIYRL